jgi:mono/diheme cytochrome c family protein
MERFWLSLGLIAMLAGCSRARTDEAGPAPADTGAPLPTDTAIVPDTGVATPPINPSPSTGAQDSALPGAPSPSSADSGPRTDSGQESDSGQGTAVSRLEYEGWRQYSVQCARCHGQDALPNPVAANLLISLAPGGPIDTPEKFSQVVSEGRPNRGMPAFKGIMTPDQIQATYAYLKGRAEKRIPAGRPKQPSS